MRGGVFEGVCVDALLLEVGDKSRDVLRWRCARKFPWNVVVGVWLGWPGDPGGGQFCRRCHFEEWE